MKNYYEKPKAAIIIVDMLNSYFKPDSILGKRKDYIVKNTNELIDFAHTKSIPVIWVRQEYKSDLSDAPLINKKLNKIPSTLIGEFNSQILLDLHKDSSDVEVIKKRYSGFFKTDLETRLKKLEINTLVIAGIQSMTCIRSTATDAYQLDYEVILAVDCVDGNDELQHTTSMTYMQQGLSTGMNNKEILIELSSYI